MRIGRNSGLAVYDYNSDVIPRVNRVNDLGIWLSTNLDFTETDVQSQHTNTVLT